MAEDRPKAENNVIDFNQAKQKLANVKSSTTVLEDLIEEDQEEYYFEFTFDNDD